MNNVNGIGNIVRDIELRYVNGDMAVTDVGVALNNRVKRNGTWTDEPCFINVTVFGRRAETIAEYLGKGDLVGVSGRLEMDTWEDKTTGKKMTRHKIVGEIHMLGPRANKSSAPKAAVADEWTESEPF